MQLTRNALCIHISALYHSVMPDAQNETVNRQFQINCNYHLEIQNMLYVYKIMICHCNCPRLTFKTKFRIAKRPQFRHLRPIATRSIQSFGFIYIHPIATSAQCTMHEHQCLDSIGHARRSKQNFESIDLATSCQSPRTLVHAIVYLSLHTQVYSCNSHAMLSHAYASMTHLTNSRNLALTRQPPFRDSRLIVTHASCSHLFLLFVSNTHKPSHDFLRFASVPPKLRGLRLINASCTYLPTTHSIFNATFHTVRYHDMHGCENTYIHLSKFFFGISDTRHVSIHTFSAVATHMAYR